MAFGVSAAPLMGLGACGGKPVSDSGSVPPPDHLSVGCDAESLDSISDATNAVASGGTVEVCDGTWDPFQVYGSMTVRARDGHHPIIDASDPDLNQGTGISVLEDSVEGERQAQTVVIEGFEVRYGPNDYNRPNISIGLENTDSSIQLDSIESWGAAGSAGISINSTGADVSMRNVEVHDNGRWGIELWCDDDESAQCDVHMDNVHVYNNLGVGLYIAGEDNTNLIADNLVVDGNGGDDLMGGSQLGGGATFGLLTGIISNSTFTSNTATDGIWHAGGVSLRTPGTVTFSACEFSGNSSSQSYAGAFQLTEGSVLFTQLTSWSDNAPNDICVQQNCDSGVSALQVYDNPAGDDMLCQYEVGCSSM